MVASPTVRAKVINWILEITGNEIVYYGSGEETTDILPSWRPTWLPEGWVTSSMYSKDSRAWWEFRDGGDSGAMLTCVCLEPSTDSMSTIFHDQIEEPQHTVLNMQGYAADYYESGDDSLLAWENQEGYLFWLKGWRVDRATLTRIAESMIFYEEADTIYEMEWVPEGYELRAQFESNGATQKEWVKNNMSLTWQYVTDPICSWEAPSREAEKVSVGGNPAKYWANQVPEEEMNRDAETDGGFQFSISYGIEESGVLIWSDPDTNTTFRLVGVLGKEDLLQMAESVEQSK